MAIWEQILMFSLNLQRAFKANLLFVPTYCVVGHITGWFSIKGWFMVSCSIKLNLKVHLQPLQCSSCMQTSGPSTTSKNKVFSSQISDLSHQLFCNINPLRICYSLVHHALCQLSSTSILYNYIYS